MEFKLYILPFYHKALILFQQILELNTCEYGEGTGTLIIIPNIYGALLMCQLCSESSLRVLTPYIFITIL